MNIKKVVQKRLSAKGIKAPVAKPSSCPMCGKAY